MTLAASTSDRPNRQHECEYSCVQTSFLVRNSARGFYTHLSHFEDKGLAVGSLASGHRIAMTYAAVLGGLLP